jgi:hypothetical protein
MKRVYAVLAAIALFGSACTSSEPSTAPTITSTTTTPAATETFTGTVPVAGRDFHSFNVLAGPLTVTLTTAGPPATITMGLGIGAPTDTTCTLFSGGSTNTPAGTTAQLSGTINSAGPLCVEIYDIGNQSGPVAYSVTVIHS